MTDYEARKSLSRLANRMEQLNTRSAIPHFESVDIFCIREYGFNFPANEGGLGVGRPTDLIEIFHKLLDKYERLAADPKEEGK